MNLKIAAKKKALFFLSQHFCKESMERDKVSIPYEVQFAFHSGRKCLGTSVNGDVMQNELREKMEVVS